MSLWSPLLLTLFFVLVLMFSSYHIQLILGSLGLISCVVWLSVVMTENQHTESRK